jgi:hypothetical protein
MQRMDGLNSEIKANAESRELTEVIEIAKNGRSSANKTKLKTILYSTADDLAKLQAAITLTEFYDYYSEGIEDIKLYCDMGIEVSKKLNMVAEESVLMATKASYLMIEYVDISTKLNYEAKMYSAIGLIPEDVNAKLNEAHKWTT